jgi:hypothetical protein
MQQAPADIKAPIERRLERAWVPAPQCPDYYQWTRFNLDSMRLTVLFLDAPSSLNMAGTTPAGWEPPRYLAVTSP